MNTLNKKQDISLIQKSNISSILVEYNQNHFKINIEGEIMEKQVNQISLKSLYYLMINKFGSIEQRLDLIEKDIKDMKFDIHNIKENINMLKKLPTILYN